MPRDLPQVVLLSSAESDGDDGIWQFHLKLSHGESLLSARDFEPNVSGERLELLALVRGLEAIDRPSRVQVVTDSRYVKRMLRYGLEEWRENDWCWEHYGSFVPIKHRDLWQRVDRAFQIHALETRRWRIDRGHGATTRRAPRRSVVAHAAHSHEDRSLPRRARQWVADEVRRFGEGTVAPVLAAV
ncbi:MAG: hypothetical protein KDA42_16430 [Planctomycetales bacterium]|nr:hypothetical protein [Planctomycetales bacterium]